MRIWLACDCCLLKILCHSLNWICNVCTFGYSCLEILYALQVRSQNVEVIGNADESLVLVNQVFSAGLHLQVASTFLNFIVIPTPFQIDTNSILAHDVC